MQFKKSVVIGVLMTLCLSTDSWCHYIPEKKITRTNKKDESNSQKDQIQICGNKLTNMIIEACDGILQSPYEVNATKGSIQRKITEDCCDRKCPLDYLQSYCGQTPLFTTKNSVRGKLMSKLNSGSGGNLNPGRKSKKNTQNDKEVRVKERGHHKKKGHENLKKKKRSFKWKCAFKSFGHYLFKLDRDNRVRNNISKRHNTINRTWPSIQIGTISPEMDKFGGPPIVVGKKNKVNTI